MVCPQCGSEYRPEFRECADCGVLLVDALPEADLSLSDAPVTVYEASDAALIALAGSILESAEIPFVTRGEGLQDFIGPGRLFGFNPITGPVLFDVSPEDAAEARKLLEELEQLPLESLDTHYGTEPEDERKPLPYPGADEK